MCDFSTWMHVVTWKLGLWVPETWDQKNTENEHNVIWTLHWKAEKSEGGGEKEEGGEVKEKVSYSVSSDLQITLKYRMISRKLDFK